MTTHGSNAKLYRTSYTVTYESDDHWAVLTQMKGSVWLSVLPYCIFNVVVMIFLTWLDNYTDAENQFKIEMSKQGHGFVSLVVAFLLLSRVNIALKRYHSARDGLRVVDQQAREICQEACVYSQDATSQAGKEWRNELALRTLLLLRTIMAVIDFPITGVAAWDVPELDGSEEKQDVQNNTLITESTRQYAHTTRTQWEETMRVPVRLAYLLRKTVLRQSKVLTPPMPPPRVAKLLGLVDGLMNGYYSLRLFLTTPVPFPLIQMARTFLFLYVFTIPFVLLTDTSSLMSHCFTVFVLTYGFVGLEVVAIELDNPFGDDPNDFDNNLLARHAVEDCCYLIYDVDGEEWADKLSFHMRDKNEPLVYPAEQQWVKDKLKRA